jgi:hypothetical protein
MEELSDELKISGVDMFMNITDVKSKDDLGMMDDDMNIDFEISNPFDSITMDKNAHKNEIPFEPSNLSSSYLGTATAKTTSGITKSSDGFSKINDIPLDIVKSTPANTVREKKRKKMVMLRKLDALFDAGKIKNRIDKNASYEDIEDEYANAQDDIKSGEYLKMSRSFFLNFIQLTEFVNGTFNPFDFDLDGLHDTVSDDIESYDDTFIEINQKYSNVKMAPELVVLCKFAFTACMINFGNKALYDNAKQAPTPNSGAVLNMMSSMMGNKPQPTKDTYTYNPSVEEHTTRNRGGNMAPATATANNNNNSSFMGSGFFSGYARPNTAINTNDDDDDSYVVQSNKGKDQSIDISSTAPKNYPLYDSPMGRDIDYEIPTRSTKTTAPMKTTSSNDNSGFDIMDNESVSMTSTTKKAKRPYRRRQSEKNTIDLDI